MADASDGKPPPGFDIPDLDLSPPARPVERPAQPDRAADPFDALEVDGFPASPAPPAAAPAPGNLDYFGAGAFDADDFDDPRQDGAALLDLADIPTGGVAGASPEGERWPSGCSPDRSALSIDAADLERVARYGPPPRALYGTPAYAWRVLSRQRALRAELGRVEEELDAAERARDCLLGGMVEAVAPALEADERLRSVLEPVRQLDAVARERSQALASTDARYRAELAKLDAERAGFEQQADAQRQVVDQLEAEHDQRDEAFRRVEARLKRSQIELRNAQEAARQALDAAGPGAKLPPEHVTRIQGIEQQAGAVQPEVDQRRSERDAAQAELAAARRQLGEIERALRGVESRRRALDQQFGKQLDAETRDVHQAEREREAALGDAGRAVLAARAPLVIDSAVLSQIRSADEGIERLARESELRLRALDVHDREAMRRGYTLVAALVGLAVLVLVLMIVR